MTGHPQDRGPARITFIGNATLLIEYGPLTLLTDPNFLHRGSGPTWATGSPPPGCSIPPWS